MSWTSFPDVYSLGLPRLDGWAATVDVTQPDKATESFFPNIAREGLAYNLLVPAKVRSADVGTWRELFGADWTAALDAAAQAGLLYVIDLRIYETLQPHQVDGFPHFQPSTVVVLVQDPATKALTPELVRVAGGGNEPKIFSRQGLTTPSAWVYALQAAKVSLTVYGIWIGHVYHWHIVTATMQMTMFDTLPASNPARRLLDPHSNYLIPFDDVLLLKWSAAAPPTSIASAWQSLELLDLYTDGREFFDDDPTTALQQLGLTESDFTLHEPWDQYPVVGQLLAIWNATSRYVDTYVDQKRVLPSVLYRITAHGFARMWRSGEPALTFVANFSPCLQDAAIPDPGDSFDTRALLRFLPNTGTIGGMVQFYFPFHFSTTYVPFVPLAGPETELPFDDEVSNCEVALMARDGLLNPDIAARLFLSPRTVESHLRRCS